MTLHCRDRLEEIDHKVSSARLSGCIVSLAQSALDASEVICADVQ